MVSKSGRPPVPARIKELSGTIRKDRIKEGIDFAIISKVPKPEVWLEPKAKKYFKNICDLLIRHKLLNEGNVPLVLIMAQEFATYEKATRELKNGYTTLVGKNNYEAASPWIAIRNQAQKNYKDIAALFGLDPLSCQKIGPAGKGDEDPFDKAIKKYEDDPRS